MSSFTVCVAVCLIIQGTKACHWYTGIYSSTLSTNSHKACETTEVNKLCVVEPYYQAIIVLVVQLYWVLLAVVWEAIIRSLSMSGAGRTLGKR